MVSIDDDHGDDAAVDGGRARHDVDAGIDASYDDEGKNEDGDVDMTG